MTGIKIPFEIRCSGNISTVKIKLKSFYRNRTDNYALATVFSYLGLIQSHNFASVCNVLQLNLTG